MSNSFTTALFTALVLLPAAYCSAEPYDDHLEPSTDYVSSATLYDYMLAAVFRSSYEGTVLNVLIAPSFKPEKLVSIHRKDDEIDQGGDDDEVVVAVPKRQIWSYERLEAHEAAKRGEVFGQLMSEDEYQEGRKDAPGRYLDVPVDRTSKKISRALTERISAVWQAALLAVAHPRKPSHGFDGTGYTFSMWVYGYGVITGSTSSPRDYTDMASLVLLAKTLEGYAKGQKAVADLESVLQRCEERFIKKGG